MHQHQRRQPPDPSSLSRAERDSSHLHPSSPTQGSGSSEDFVSNRIEQQGSAVGAGAGAAAAAAVSATTLRLNQIIQNFHTKAALIILHGRAELSPAISRKTGEQRVNKWFNIEVDETEDYNNEIKLWRTCDTEDNRPPPLIIETYLMTDPLPAGQRLVILDDSNKRWDVYNSLEGQREGISHRVGVARQILLERWTIKLGDQTAPLPADLATVLPVVYKKSIVLFRALYTYANFLPAHRLMKKLGRGRTMMGIKIGYRIVNGDQLDSVPRADNLATPLTDSRQDVTTDYSFGYTDSPAGPFSINVRYRTHSDFRVDETDELLSSRFLGAEQTSRPSQTQIVGSLPVDQRKNLLERPDLGHAYGSLATFHQAGIDPGTSPLSTLRQAQEYGRISPSSENRTPPPPPLAEPAQPVSRPVLAASNRPSSTGRRSSFNFSPFKTPSLSQSPLGSSPLAASPRITSARVIPTLGSLTEEPVLHHQHHHDDEVSSLAINVSTSSSPKPQPSQRFQSSFSHRRNRLSIDRPTSKAEDDQLAADKQSMTSSQQPNSGLIPPAAGSDGSSESFHDAENVHDFLNMLDGKKDLLSLTSSTAITAATLQTAIALNKFHKMRDTNTALSESMSSSLMMRSGSRQTPLGLPSVSSSPNKPASPHTPHTPFAPSRLSAAFSHDDFKDAREEPEPSPQAEETTIDAVHGIDIPSSPRRYVPGYRRSSSVQRRSSNEDDIADLYGFRSHSMGSKGRKDSEDIQPRHYRQNSQAVIEANEPEDPLAETQTAAIPMSDGPNESLSAAHRSRYRAAGRLSQTSPGLAAAGSSSSGTTTGSWLNRRGSRTQNPAALAQQRRKETGEEEDELDLPFVMDTSQFRR